MNKSELIREYKKHSPELSTSDIAAHVDVKRSYVAHILWKAKQPTTKKADFEKAFQQQLAQNEELKKQLEKLEDEAEKLRYVIKFLRAN